MSDTETLVESTHDKLVSRLTRVACVSIGDSADTLWAIRHYTGSGVYTKLLEFHVIRGQKFLGRFEIQDEITFEAAWQPAKDSQPPTNAELALFRKARMLLLGMIDKLWT